MLVSKNESDIFSTYIIENNNDRRDSIKQKCHGSTPRHSVRPCPLAGGQGQWRVTWLSTDGRPLSYSLDPYPRIDCYSRLRSLTRSY
jgi:hypothetical protein